MGRNNQVVRVVKTHAPARARRSRKGKSGHYSTIPLVYPPSQTVKVQFNNYTSQGVLSSNYLFNDQYRLGGPFFPDLAQPTTTLEVPGLLTWGLMYCDYRVLCVDVEYEVCNMNAFPVFAFIQPRASSPASSTPTTWAGWTAMIGNSRNQHRLLGEAGAGKNQWKFRQHIDLARLEGRSKASYMGDPGYLGVTNCNGATPTNPNNGALLRVGMLATGNSSVVLAASSIGLLQLTYTIRFSGRTVIEA